METRKCKNKRQITLNPKMICGFRAESRGKVEEIIVLLLTQVLYTERLENENR